MANPDTPNGFKFVKSMSGSPASGMLRSAPVSGADIFKGDIIAIEGSAGAKLAEAATTNDETFLGVAVSFGKVSDMQGEYGGAFNPDDLTTLYYDDSASTNTDWRVWYVPVEGNVFEVQSSGSIGREVGDAVDLINTTGSTTTGISAHEINTSTNADMIIVDIPAYPDNDKTLTNALYHVMFSTSTIASN